MTDEDRHIDARLVALFTAPELTPDETFVARVERVLLAERKIARARQAAWRRFGVESLASASIVTTFYLLWRLSPELALDTMPIAPAAAAVLVLFLWFGVELRPAARS